MKPSKGTDYYDHRTDRSITYVGYSPKTEKYIFQDTETSSIVRMDVEDLIEIEIIVMDCYDEINRGFL